MLANEHPTHPDEIDANRAKQEILSFLETKFNVSSAATSCGLRRRLVYQWIDEDVEFRHRFLEIRDGWLDKCEERNLDEGAHSKNAVAQRYGMLKAYRPELFGDRLELSQNTTLTLDVSPALKRLKDSMAVGSAEVLEGVKVGKDIEGTNK